MLYHLAEGKTPFQERKDELGRFVESVRITQTHLHSNIDRLFVRPENDPKYPNLCLFP